MQTLQIRNSTAEFLIFTKQKKEKSIEVIVDDKSVWLSQKLIAESFETMWNNITMQLNNILNNELDKNQYVRISYILQVMGKIIKLNITI